MTEDLYNTRRAAEADRLARDAGDPRVRAAHEHFAEAYRKRLEPKLPQADLPT